MRFPVTQIWPPRRKKRFSEIATDVLALKRLKSKKTYLAAKLHIMRLVRFFGNYALREISESSWTEYVLQEQQKRSRKFFDDRKYMRMILLHSLREGLIEKKVRLPIPDVPTDCGKEITHDELQRLFRAANPELRFQIEIALKMGLRLREMLKLRWDQFDWTRLTINLRSLDTKTRRKREVPINPDLTGRFRSKFDSNLSTHVFPSPKSNNRPQGNNKTAWRLCKKKAGVSARWHDLRHTCASRMIRRGISAHVTQSYLGMSESVLTRIYLHLSIDDLRDAAKAMSDRPN